MAIHALEKELCEATKVKISKRDRQSGLQEIARAIEKLPNDDYENLSNDAVDWYEAAVAAMNKGKEAPDFASTEPEPNEDAEDGEPEASAEADSDGDTATEAESVSDAVAEEPDAEVSVPRPKKAAKKAKGKKEAPVAAPKPKKPLPKGPPTRYDNLTGNKNRYGIYAGTISDDVCTMLEKGCTQAEIKKEHGETKYNLMKKLIEFGHRIEKVDGKFVLTHKDDIKAKGKKK